MAQFSFAFQLQLDEHRDLARLTIKNNYYTNCAGIRNFFKRGSKITHAWELFFSFNVIVCANWTLELALLFNKMTGAQ